LSKVTFVVKFYEDPLTFSRDMSQNVKNALSRNVEEYFKKFLDPDPEADDVPNLTSSSLSTDTSICVKTFTKICPVVFMPSC